MSPRVDDVGDDAPDARASSAVVARARALRETLRRRDDDYEVDRPGARASLDAIVADPAWLAEYEELKRLERALAGAPRAGCCARYVARKRRFCVAKARDGGTMCSRHRAFEDDEGGRARASEVDAEERLCRDAKDMLNVATTATTATTAHDGKKKNLNRRMKKMTNPMSAPFQAPLALDEAYWSSAFGDARGRPLLVDVGTAKGGFIKALATERAEAFTRAKRGVEFNLLGVEIYPPLVRQANAWARANEARLRLPVHFVAANANVSLESMNLPNVRAVCVQFPDPWSRGRHFERRVMTPEFARALANVLPSGGELFCCSDVKALACEMYDVVAANGDFTIDEATYARVGDMDESAVPASLDDVPEHDAAHKFEWEPLPDVKPIHNRRWLRANPYEAFTERDIVCEGKWRPVYRFAVARK